MSNMHSFECVPRSADAGPDSVVGLLYELAAQFTAQTATGGGPLNT